MKYCNRNVWFKIQINIVGNGEKWSDITIRHSRKWREMVRHFQWYIMGNGEKWSDIIVGIQWDKSNLHISAKFTVRFWSFLIRIPLYFIYVSVYMSHQCLAIVWSESHWDVPPNSHYFLIILFYMGYTVFTQE